LPWIKTLSIFYFENICNISGINVRWNDSPNKTWDNKTINPTITIEVYEKSDADALIYDVKVFITTGTIRDQGAHHLISVEKYFHILRAILDLVLKGHQSDKGRICF
jgi:hypothetical protein